MRFRTLYFGAKIRFLVKNGFVRKKNRNQQSKNKKIFTFLHIKTTCKKNLRKKLNLYKFTGQILAQKAK